MIAFFCVRESESEAVLGGKESGGGHGVRVSADDRPWRTLSSWAVAAAEKVEVVASSSSSSSSSSITTLERESDAGVPVMQSGHHAPCRAIDYVSQKYSRNSVINMQPTPGVRMSGGGRDGRHLGSP